ncbi:MAG: hypothetical protein Ct9H300mP4_07950 [Gammaproteobacteria bacterium]|nr:MAG: hypothetical protein Ct9H300mP4_07950 [Gammaproteobacteria bacterium]
MKWVEQHSEIFHLHMGKKKLDILNKVYLSMVEMGRKVSLAVLIKRKTLSGKGTFIVENANDNPHTNLFQYFLLTSRVEEAITGNPQIFMVTTCIFP